MPDLDLQREMEILKLLLCVVIFLLFLTLETPPEGLQTQNTTTWCCSVQSRM